MAAFLQNVQKLLQPRSVLLKVVARQSLIASYDKKEGVPRDFLCWLQQDLSLPAIRQKLRVTSFQLDREDQKYRPERHKILGPDLATAHFIVKRKGAVKFVGHDSWFRLNKAGRYNLPNRRVDGMELEAVDASGTKLMSAGFENFVDLENLRYLNVSNCVNMDDWCLACFHQFADTLEFLDISDCPQITERGIACLHHLKHLQALKMKNLPKVENPQLVILMLEELLPNCKIFGPDYNTIHNELETDGQINQSGVITQDSHTAQPETQVQR
ncbi:distal membrane-arm assembly complex protein 2-like [Gigantopelta aegis]|uniref:distal membrane-arm assembly complex protein 2-like n=1 Tax=Gigantopelta aegis TaxID=1735272 RepID=UPI001B88BDF6|nr:distal membrane-arm assembly complex protein 2-like [Gigantopelta aegis]